MEDLVSAAVFITALTALFVFVVLTLKPFMPAKVVEAPVAPSDDAPTRRVYVYNASGRLYAVEYAGSDVEGLQKSRGSARLPRGGFRGVSRRLPLCEVYTRGGEAWGRPLHRPLVPAAV